MSIARNLFRRTTIATSVAVVAASAVIAPRVGTLHAKPTSTSTTIEPSNEWLKGLKGKHRQFFDAPTANGGVPLVHVMNYYDTYNKAYAVPDRDINGILTFYGTTTFYGLKDTMWAKYRIGEFLETNDAVTGKPATANPWRTAPVALGLTLPQASIESMQKRGATFIICNNALGIFADMLAKARGLPTDSVYTDLKANILPGVTLVPGMVVAIEKAQGRGIAYHRQ